MPRRSPLLTWTHGDRNGPPVLLLHDRYDNPGGMPVDRLPSGARVVCVRSARTQMTGADTLGHFWFLGPYDRPEPTTFGDGLHHLETLLVDLSFGAGKARSFIIGKGEGGVMALTLATIWPELLAGVVSIDGPLPQTLGSLPIEPRPPLRLPVLLLEQARSMAGAAAALSGLGAEVDLRKVGDQPMRAALDWLDLLIGRTQALTHGTTSSRPGAEDVRHDEAKIAT
ncbi:hypothetical protein [Labrys wisconsinensis]|uniref:Pimeloyl-ACP methyl ester carboxylesterase n=1 Tax=Labrys wisconsinensis TaxID=425677 RepID=A0ABU0JI37_9HYPH|nr:hypothetical protein [Labrys wisconsinensis]MDQ0473945.1 pimeloyl-ACP methyl ester carboxylesterase [Labrys wisconsinensis]